MSDERDYDAEIKDEMMERAALAGSVEHTAGCTMEGCVATANPQTLATDDWGQFCVWHATLDHYAQLRWEMEANGSACFTLSLGNGTAVHAVICKINGRRWPGVGSIQDWAIFGIDRHSVYPFRFLEPIPKDAQPPFHPSYVGEKMGFAGSDAVALAEFLNRLTPRRIE